MRVILRRREEQSKNSWMLTTLWEGKAEVSRFDFGFIVTPPADLLRFESRQDGQLEILVVPE